MKRITTCACAGSLLAGILLLSASFCFAAEVVNLNAKQEGSSIIFNFDVTAEGGETETEVMVVISADGKELREDRLHLRGDYGKVAVGKSKTITWDVLKDFPKGLGGDISWGITAKRNAAAETTSKESAETGGNEGIITDPKTGFQWVPAPDRPMTWSEAQSHVSNLSLGGGGWRMPTRSELKGLYDGSVDGGIDPAYNVRGNAWVWTSETQGSSAWGINFASGREARCPHGNPCDSCLALAVRSSR